MSLLYRMGHCRPCSSIFVETNMRAGAKASTQVTQRDTEHQVTNTPDCIWDNVRKKAIAWQAEYTQTGREGHVWLFQGSISRTVPGWVRYKENTYQGCRCS